MPRAAGRVRVGRWLVCAVVLSTACRGATMKEDVAQGPSLQDVPDTVWTELGRKRIFFGHQSVGAGIMEGVARLAREDPRVGIRVADGESALSGAGGVFAHETIGRNGEPGLKTDEFARRMEGPLTGRVDIAFHKYCYADISESTDIPAVFEHYRQTMARLRAEYPNVVFVHVTTPLVRVQSGPRAVIKKLLGRSPVRYAANMARERFNDMMRKTYGGKEPLFDLAAIESTRPDGTRETIELRGQRSYALVPAYTGDGSHLDDIGQQRVARALLVFLARLSPAR
jgi:hypothetical protein